MNHSWLDSGDWCDICGDTIPAADVKNMYIDGCEKTLCKSCRGEIESKLKVVDTLVLKDMLTLITKKYGQHKVRQLNLVKAEQYVKENNISLEIEKRGGKFNQEKLGVFVKLSNDEILSILQFLQRKIGGHLWMHAAMGTLLDKQLVYTLQLQEGDQHGRATDDFFGEFVY
ncbi:MULTISPECIES: hypothetical protein [Bacillus cereus group]|uniref:hypothetical protein n=1 Tax=Bacillus cereus group TaxID=86661 RepID=UPI001F5AE9BC|nr:hypothetical protein [Bacillus cereus group sp. BfR-BA-01522]